MVAITTAIMDPLLIKFTNIHNSSLGVHPALITCSPWLIQVCQSDLHTARS